MLHLRCKHQYRVEVLHLEEGKEPQSMRVWGRGNNDHDTTRAACFRQRLREVTKSHSSLAKLDRNLYIQKVERSRSTSHTFQAGSKPNGNCRRPVCTHILVTYDLEPFNETIKEEKKKGQIFTRLLNKSAVYSL